MKYMLRLAQNWLKVNFMSLKSAEKTTFPSDIPQNLQHIWLTYALLTFTRRIVR